MIEDRAREIEYIGLEYWLWVKKSDSKKDDNIVTRGSGSNEGRIDENRTKMMIPNKIKFSIERKNNLNNWKVACVIQRGGDENVPPWWTKERRWARWIRFLENVLCGEKEKEIKSFVIRLLKRLFVFGETSY